MPVRTYSVNFHRTAVGQDGVPMHQALLQAHARHGDHLPAVDIGAGEFFQLRDLQRVGRVWQGVFGRLRSDPPPLVDAQGRERALDLDDGDRLLEKSHFLYRQLDDVLVWQKVRSVAGWSGLQNYLTQVFREPTLLPQVMNDAELERVLNGSMHEISFAYDRPRDLRDNAPLWNRNTFDMMESLHAANAKFSLRAPRGQSLTAQAKTLVRQLLRGDGIRKVRVKLTDETDLVELFMAPLKAKIEVNLRGRYPLSSDVFVALEEVYGEHRASIPPRQRAAD